MDQSSLPTVKSHTLAALLRGWIVLWMLAVPLFHVHPEADHRHGETGHVHGGTVHTVFSGDLDGEFGTRQDPAHATAGLVSPPAHNAHEYGEVGVSLLNDSSERKSFKPPVAHIAIAPVEAALSLPGHHAAEPAVSSAPSVQVCAGEISSRAPPAFLA